MTDGLCVACGAEGRVYRDASGERFCLSCRTLGRESGALTAVRTVFGTDLFTCLCQCGRECLVRGKEFREKRISSCGSCDYARSHLPTALMVGARFGRLIVKAVVRFNGRLWVRCRCACGSVRLYKPSRLRAQLAKSCGCARELENLTGQSFGLLTILGPAPAEPPHRMWRCRCVCEREITRSTGELHRPNTYSCGCSRRRA